MQKANRQSQLREPEFRLVPTRVRADPVEDAGQIQGFRKVQMAVQRNRLPSNDRLMELVVPDQNLLRADAADVKREWHGGFGQIDRLHCRAKVKQAVPTRDLEQTLAQLAQDNLLLGSPVLPSEVCHARQIELEIDILLAVVL